MQEEERVAGRSGRVRRWWALGALVALVAVGYVVLALWAGGRVPADASVGGVPVGGRTQAQAAAAVAEAVRADPPPAAAIRTPEGTTVRLDPKVARLMVDSAASVRGLTEVTFNPVRLWERLTGGVDQPLVAQADRAAVTAAVTAAAAKVGRAEKEGSVSVATGKVAVVEPVTGRSLDVAATTDAVLAAWPQQPTVDAVVVDVEPKVSSAEVERAAEEFAKPAVSGPVTITAGTAAVRLDPADFGPAVTIAADGDGTLEPTVDAKKLAAAVRKAKPSVETAAVDATWRLSGAKPVVVPARTGQTLDGDALAAPFLAALTEPAAKDRTVKAVLAVRQPAVTTAQATAWKVTEVMSSFRSVFPTGSTNAARTHNIKVAAAALNGTFVKPGEQFSLNATLGQRTAAKGYQSAPVIKNGRLAKDYGGGVSQVSTTLYNTAYFAGVQLDRHKPHSFYISRYPEGREATVSWPDVDNRWTNDSGYGILIQSWVEGNAVRMRFWGQKTYDVDSVKGPRRDVKEPEEITDDSPGCVPQSASPGFTVTVTRILSKGGKRVGSDSFTTVYIPEDHVTCTHPDAG